MGSNAGFIENLATGCQTFRTRMKRSNSWFFLVLPVFLASAIISLGTYWSFERGGHDFSVFYQAWRLVLGGQASEIYVNSPDRFLYAPGFAWLLCPLGIFPQWIALALWNLAKACAVYGLLRRFAEEISARSRVGAASALALAAWGLVLVARPVLIDFQYGQVNTLILSVCAWALFSYFGKSQEPGSRVSLAWFLLGVAAVSKLFALPLLLLPWVGGKKHTARSARIAGGLGAGVTLLIPVVTEGWGGAIRLMRGWQEALAAKGLPLESHNQSFVSLLEHYFTGASTHVIALGTVPVQVGHELLAPGSVAALALAWSFAFSGILLAWLFGAGKKIDSFRWIAIATGLLLTPSYLIWKPYFVMTYPLAVLLLWRYRSSYLWLIVLGFTGINLSGFDFSGGYLAARLEAASIFLLVHLAYLGCAFWGRPDFAESVPSGRIDVVA